MPKHLIQSALGTLGLRLIRWPKGVPLDAATVPAPSDFFPTGPIRPWTIPTDLRALASAGVPWAAELVELYQHNAAWPSSIAPEAGMLLQALVRNIQPETVVETGTCVGASTVWMAAGLDLLGSSGPARVIHTFDDFRDVADQRLALSPLFQNRLDGVRQRFERAGVAGRIHIHVGDSKVKLIEARVQLGSGAGGMGSGGSGRGRGGVQLAFIDGDHSAGGALADLLAIEPVLSVGGYVLFHDTFPSVSNHTGPRHVVDNLGTLAAGKYQLCDLYTAQTNYGLTLLRRIG